MHDVIIVFHGINGGVMVDKIRVYWTDKNNETIEITKVVRGLNWGENTGSHAMECGFSVPDSNERYLEHYAIEAGDKIRIKYESYDGKYDDEYYFVVIDVERNCYVRSISCKDLAFYLEKNDIVIQFVGESGVDAIKKVCNKLGIEVEIDCNIPVKMYGVYIDSAESVIEEILDRQKKSSGIKLSYEMKKNKLMVYELPEEPEYYRHKPAINVNEYDVSEHHTEVKYKHSIEGMKNAINAIIKSSTDDNMPAIEYSIEDTDSIKRYGRLEGKINVSAEDQLEIDEIAKNELNDKNKVSREISCSMIGAINARINRVMHIVDEYTGIDALMRINDISHSVEEGIYLMNVGLEYIKEYEAKKLKESKIQREEIDLNGKAPNFYDETEGSSDSFFNKVYGIAKGYLGVPYVNGGYSPRGFDCSGFVCYILKMAGMNIGRTTAQGLYNMTKRVKSPKPGDLVFWIKTNPNSPNLITHVGYCIGGGKNIQSGGTKVHIGSNGGAYAYGRF